ncbi:MAG: hypothetical protein N3A59_01835 [Thermodesulfovibrionales bacterium]|nr:hypothetical protein [Thermodesulfovibrionales bacterium]
MNELAKLNKLLHHWMEHNDEHADTYKEWSEKASSLGKKELADILLQLYSETKKLNFLFKKAIDKLE